MRFLALAVAAAILAPATAFAGGGGMCGGIDEFGVCEGTTLKWCDMGELQTITCTTSIDATAGCIVVSDEWGADCAAAVGETCVFAFDDGTTDVVVCQGNEAGCIEDAESFGTCVENAGTCTSTDAGTCRQERFIIACTDWGQPHMVDCASVQGRCTDTGCADIPEGGYCDMRQRCADGLTCVENVCTGSTPPPPDGGIIDIGAADAAPSSRPDVGFGAPDARTSGGARRDGNTPTEDDDGCSCRQAPAAPGSSPSGAWMLALVAAALIRRRR